MPLNPAEVEAREHLVQALLAETLGDNAARTKRLMTAIKTLPALNEAQWHLGQIEVSGKWQSLAAAEAAARNDAQQIEYRALRDGADNPKLVLNLARWCVKNDWEGEARLHYAQLLTSADSTKAMRTEAIKRLDVHHVNGTWMTGDDLAAQQAASQAIEEAIGKWQLKLRKLQVAIDGSDFAIRDKALAELKAIDDPAIIPVLELLLGVSDSPFHEAAVAKLATFGEYEATAALVKYAVLSNFSLARSDATTALGKRPMHEYVPLLLEGLTAPIKSQFQVTWDAGGRINYQHAFLREGAAGNLLLVAQRLALPLSMEYRSSKDDRVLIPCGQQASSSSKTYSGGTTPLEAFRDRLSTTSTQAVTQEARVTIANSAIDRSNQRLFEVLEKAIGNQLKREPIEWWTWWTGYNEYDWPRPTQCLYQSMASYYSAHQYHFTHTTGTKPSCFLAGTPVRTQTGFKAIETIQPGDRVVSQDQDTGELAYKLVLRTTLRPPAEMLKITAGSEAIVTTLGHPFWVVGHGWRMSKQLNVGDLLHSVDGAVRIEKIEPAEKQPAHNLVVADFNSYFVGKQSILVHDNEYRKPTTAIVPGLATD
jgi:hypothetical protein